MPGTRCKSLILLSLLIGFSYPAFNQRAPTRAEIRAANKADSSPQYFPSSFDPFEREWYHQLLAIGKQPSLYEQRQSGTETYRFSWIPSFNPSIFALLEAEPDGSAVLRLTEVRGPRGGRLARPGIILRTKQGQITKEQMRLFRTALATLNYWNITDGYLHNKGISGTDGSQWVLEGIHEGRFHVVEQWTPGSGPLHDVGILLIKTFGGWDEKDVLSY